MRSFVLLALVAVAVAATQPAIDLRAASRAPLDLANSVRAQHRELQAAHAMVKAKRNAFRAMQDATTEAPEVALSVCEVAYLTDIDAAQSKCPAGVIDAIFLLSLLNPENATQVADGATLCSVGCLTDIYKVVANYTKCDSPLARAIEYIVGYIQMTCSKNQFEKYCFTTFGRLTYWALCPFHETEAACTESKVCEFREGTCSELATNKILGDLCVDTCMVDLLGFIAASESDSESSGDTAGFLDFTCMNVNGAYCVLAFDEVRVGANDTYKTVASKFCKNETRAGCLALNTAITSAKSEQKANNAFVKCANTSGYDQKQCLTVLHKALLESDQTTSSNNFLCATTNNTQDGRYCGEELFETMFSNDTFIGCLGAAFNGDACTTECDGVVASAFNKSGCCAFYYGDFTSKARLSDARIPEVRGGPNTSTWTFAAAGVEDIQPFTEFDKCATVKASRGNYGRCVGSTSSAPGARRQAITAVSKTLETEVAWEAISSSSRRVERLRLAMRKDVAASIGTVDESIIEDSLAASTRMVTIRDSKTRTRSVAGTRYSFKIRDTTQAKTTAASTTFDRKAAAGELTMVTANNQMRPSNCKKCLNDGSSSVVLRPLQAQAAAGSPVPTRAAAPGAPPVTTRRVAAISPPGTPATPGTPAKSSAARMSAVAAAVVAVLALLL